MKLTISLTAFMGFFWVLPSEVSTDNTEVPSPRIIQPIRSKIVAVLGKRLVIECKADPGLPDDFALVYWLVNGTFPEVADGRVSETEESVSEDGRVLQRSLVFKSVTAEDFRSTFTCVINSPAGLDQRTVTLMTNHKAIFPPPSPTPNTKPRREQ
ncbi:interleukin-1 receptor type 2 isoform X1 [Salvelinus sp. IW2-2015]|uniref:interleukin-1 receptor type 2 isoform X1 n=1 Tax=Salvelinus sp. IW2-2015 TaxID=2691554 RepID=UPI000CDF7BD8|nr:interleukin-18-binding protein isoform X1 [Salvelinus alpinus]